MKLGTLCNFCNDFAEQGGQPESTTLNDMMCNFCKENGYGRARPPPRADAQ